MPQPLETGLYHLIEAVQLLFQSAPARGCEAIRLTSLVGLYRTNPTLSLESCNCSVQCSGPEAHIRELLNVLHHRVAVFISSSQAGKNKKRWIRHRYYVVRSIVGRNKTVCQ